jgi:GAF domain-containing protein
VLGELIRHPEPLRLEDVSYHARSYGFPVGHPDMHTFVGVPILVRGQAWGNLYLTEKAGGEEFAGTDEEALVVLADWAAIAIQNARLYRGVLERRDELERVVGTLEATDEISRAVGGELELERILELIAKRGRALVEARALLIALLQGDEMRIAAIAGQVPRDMLGAVANVEGTVGGAALRTGRTERLGVHASGLRAPWAKALGAKSGLIVPLRFRSRSLGVIAA